ncbi:alpha/beta hydrolase [Argonema antarcticum]|uniref:alpha/beta hydrolase n=1 Tax=Argonema antarcticum TaxID=2942763 RepID=UPI00201255C6|nr:alpha/beta hydrolase [Argonema antarcticum]MCL1469511.1 alpha/beta hydrolase [Argonema antarcticum A004/B2]
MTKILVAFLIKLLKVVVGPIALAYSSACLFLFFWQNHFIFFPSSVIEITPAAFARFEDVWLPVSNRSGKVELIHGWWIPGKGQQTVLYLHGNGINVGANVAHAIRLHKLGVSVLLIDYRGYGRSEGKFPTEKSVYHDAETAWNYLIEKRHISPKDILIYGHSLGGAIAIDLAVQHPDAAALIVQSSFTSMSQMVNERPTFRIFPTNLILRQRFDSISKVGSLKTPVLFIHGMDDSVIPYRMSQILFAAAPEPKQLFLVPKADHNNVADVAGVKYLQTVQNFVELADPKTNK